MFEPDVVDCVVAVAKGGSLSDPLTAEGDNAPFWLIAVTDSACVAVVALSLLSD